MVAAEILLFAYSSLFILLLQSQSQRCVANANPNPNCTPSACGIIPNISHPFRLKGDPKYCGVPEGELACENNVTFFYLNSHKYSVKAINYINRTIRLADASINTNDACSFPTYSAYYYNFTSRTVRISAYYYRLPISTTYPYDYTPLPINIMSCPHPLKNSSTFTDITHCQNSTTISSNSRFTYIKIGRMKASDVTATCRVDVIVLTSWGFKDFDNNVSLEEIHRSLLYGFELYFSYVRALWGNIAYKLLVFVDNRLKSPYIILLAIQAVYGSAVIPVMSIIGVTIVFGFLLITAYYLHLAIRYQVPSYLFSNFLVYDSTWNRWNSGLISSIAIIFGPRLLISLFLTWLLIKKLRRRHLSRFDRIERFLQSDNKLLPIRYSYSDIKKMTINFQDKLGEGGYGSVYKGKLRSGIHVAVKLLGKSKSNDQEFMNEIATIGRIHHVNIVRLVGYCAEGSKRALVLDFMSNGSLEKYIFNEEKMNSLNWDTKFEIVVGVARGIEYLHRGCDIQILHFDIKPHNILLDDKFTPKVSDFGLAKIFSTEKNTLTLTAARGTIGYVAPELINRGIGRVSYKADVYSYGMLLMEMLGLKRDLRGNDDDSSKYFPCWIYDRFNQDKEFNIGSVDEIENDGDNESSRALVRKMTIVALWCIQMNPDDRPSMNKVLEMLEVEVEHLQIPPYPLGYPDVELNEDDTWGTSSKYSDSLSLLPDKDAPNVEITIEDFRTLPY